MSMTIAGNGIAVSRRNWLRGSVALGALALVAGFSLPIPSMAAEASHPEFMRLSQFLTGKDGLDEVLGGRYYAALAKRHPQIGADVAGLLKVIDTTKAANMDALLALPDFDKAMKASATTIVSAWYLGIVGEAADAELISYSDALMYRPTRGILIVPTYGAGPNAWGEKPV